MTLISKTEQTVGEARVTVAVNDDDVQAGYNNVSATQNAAGGFLSYPAGASLGSAKWFASNNAGNFAITYTNASFAQATNFKVNDPANAAGVFLIGAGTAPFVSGNILMASGTGGLMADSGVPAANYAPLTATVTMLTAGVVGAYAAPVQIIAGVSNKAIVVLSAVITTEVSTPFATGGIAQLQWGNTVHAGGTLATGATIAAAEITAASSQIFTQGPIAAASVVATSAVTGLGLYFTNATGPYTNGTASTVAVTVQYMLVPAV